MQNGASESDELGHPTPQEIKEYGDRSVRNYSRISEVNQRNKMFERPRLLWGSFESPPFHLLGARPSTTQIRLLLQNPFDHYRIQFFQAFSMFWVKLFHN